MKQIIALLCFLLTDCLWAGEFIAQIDRNSCKEFTEILEQNFKYMETALDSREFKSLILKEYFNDANELTSQELYDLIQFHRNAHNFKFKVYCYDPRIRKSITKLDLQDISDIHEKQMAAFVLRGKREMYVNLYPIMEYLYELEGIREMSPEKYKYAVSHQYRLAGKLFHEILHMPGFDFEHPYEKEEKTSFFVEAYYGTVPVMAGTLLTITLAEKDKSRAFSIWVDAKNK